MAGSLFDFSDHPWLGGRTSALLMEEAVGRAANTVRPPVTMAPETTGARAVASRTPEERRWYAGKPDAYFADILGWALTRQQLDVLALLEASSRVLIPSANSVGKTFVIAGYGVYVMDALAAVPDPETGDYEQGARILLPGPDHDTVFETIYSQMLVHAARAESRGYLMPGERSDRSVLWRVRPQWHVEVLTPAHRVQRTVAHTASGRHHRNQVALIEEGQGVEESLWRAAEGMCSAAGNKIASPFNPTEPVGPAFQRSRSGAYVVMHLDAFQHPNITGRSTVVSGAIDFLVVDGRVRTDCRDRGPYPETPLDPDQGDFVYAVPELGAPESGPRADGYLGHPHAPLRVYRPNGAFSAQVRGEWPRSLESSLFDLARWDQGVARWRLTSDPRSAPDRVGADVARSAGGDENVAAPAWGDPAEVLLRAYADAEAEGPIALRELVARRRARVGELVVIPTGDGPDVAARLNARFPDSPFYVDLGGIGASPTDHLARVLRRDAVGVSFSAAPRPVLPGEPWSDNLRTQLYVRAAMLVARGLVDPPDDLLLREEIMAHQVIPSARTAEVYSAKKQRTEKVRVPSVALIAKDLIKKLIGRSPDRSDAYVLSLYHEPVRKSRAQIPPSVSSVSLG